MLKYIVLFLGFFWLPYQDMIYYQTEIEPKIREAKVEQELLWSINESLQLQWRLKNALEIFTHKDKKRVFDCFDRLTSRSIKPSPYRDRNNIGVFNSGKRDNVITGFIDSNKFPMLFSVHNHKAYLPYYSLLILGIRGMDWGMHKTPLARYLIKFIKDHNDYTLILLDSYIYLDKKKDLKTSKIQSTCFGRTYPAAGHINNYWPVLKNHNGWNIINRFFPYNNKMIIIGWSNGSSPRDQFMKTNIINEEKFSFYNIKNYEKFKIRYSENTKFIKEKEIDKIKGVVDIETNYSKSYPIWNTIKWLWEYVNFYPEKFYYASCNVSMGYAVINHITIIRALNMIGVQRHDGSIRYKNLLGNIIIDIFPRPNEPHYRHREANLESQTKIWKYPIPIRKWADYNHNQLVPYSLKQLRTIIGWSK